MKKVAIVSNDKFKNKIDEDINLKILQLIIPNTIV